MTKGDWAVVVGATGALGAAVSQVLAADGWNVLLGYGRQETAAQALAEELQGLGVDADQVSVDLASEAGAEALTEAVAERPVRSFVYAAGPHVPQAYVAQIEPAQYRDQLVVESVGFFTTLRALLPRLRENGGSVVALTSAALRKHPPRDVLGVAPKAAIEALVRATAVEEGRFGIRANSVAVGMIDAGITTRLIESGDLPPTAMEQVRRALPLKRFGTPTDIADVVAFLVSDRSAFVTGQSIAVDGGGSV
ncbi:3-oxoacyl-[acyl-carrier-protein] reductase [Pseudonocardia kongjuensis]|uniref:3-oxoacyl-[acyl-carrier-protein] reductase n=1 Tax=Pseudonocardia kongjuensis TaxID=102227 RepID=A0ABN1Y5C4_9PSEU